MDIKLSRYLLVGAFAGAAVVAGCSGGSNSSAPIPAQQQTQQVQRTVDSTESGIGVDACKKPVKEPVNAAGGKFTLAGGCKGINGFVTYASNNAPSGTTTTIEAYKSNPGGVPTPSSGKVLAFLSSLGTSTVTFSGTTSAQSQLTGKVITTAHSYSLYAYALGFLAPGFPVNIGTPSKNGVINFATPLQNGEQVPGGITVYFELVQN